MFGVWCSMFDVWGLGLGFKVWGFGFGVWREVFGVCFELRGSVMGVETWGLGSGFWGFGVLGSEIVDGGDGGWGLHLPFDYVVEVRQRSPGVFDLRGFFSSTELSTPLPLPSNVESLRRKFPVSSSWAERAQIRCD